MTPAERAILRTLCFHDVWGSAPTRAELCSQLDVASDVTMRREEVTDALHDLLEQGRVSEVRGRFGFPDTLPGLARVFTERDGVQPRKRRHARRIAGWLARLSGVRFVALANTTALGNARDDGDLDFFVIAKKGSIWSTRLFGGAPFRLFRWTPSPGHERDAVCLSYFITDDGLDLSSHLLTPNDPCYRQWFLSMVPLYDDGVSRAFWDANAALRRRHPFAERWVVPPDLRIPAKRLRLPTRIFEGLAKMFQMRWFPASILERMNKDTTVLVNDRVLKFHVTDSRAEDRRRYEDACRSRGIDI